MRQLSYSQVNLYEKCPELWYQNYILKRWPPKPPQFKFGNIVHESLAHVLVNGLESALEVITPILFDYSKQPEKDRDLACDLVKEGIAILQKLNIDYQNTSFFQVEELIEYDDFKGFIDLNIRSQSNKSHIIDWKTTSVDYQEHDILSSDQLTCYAWLYWRKYNELPDYLSYITLNKKDCKAVIFTSTRTFKDIEEYSRKVSFIADQVNSQVRYKNPRSCLDKYGQCSHYQQCWPERFIKIQCSPQRMDFII